MPKLPYRRCHVGFEQALDVESVERLRRRATQRAEEEMQSLGDVSSEKSFERTSRRR